MRAIVVVLVVLCANVVGCGSDGGGGPDCGDGQHRADPDGRGERCIEDVSACATPTDCAEPADPCCEAACADPHGLGVYECVQNCNVPSCTEGSCGEGMRCAPDEDGCGARCVPDDLDCPLGKVAADPTGSGTFICVRLDSECLEPADCAGRIADACCSVACADSGDSRYTCQTSCAGDAGVACMCTTDEDCERENGPGWTCSQGGCYGGCFCNPPVDCECVEGAYVPVCGADGQTYDAACGDSCVPVEIACRQECPCPV